METARRDTHTRVRAALETRAAPVFASMRSRVSQTFLFCMRSCAEPCVHVVPLIFALPHKGGSLRESWLGLRVIEGQVSSGLRLSDDDYRDRGNLHRQSDILVSGVPPSRDFKLFAAWQGRGGCFPEVQSAYAFVNPSPDETAEVELTFFGEDSLGIERRAEAKLSIPPRQRVARTLAGLFPGVFTPQDSLAPCTQVVVAGSGVVNASANVPIAVQVLQVNLRNGHFVNLPGSAIESDDGSPDEE